MRLFADIIKTDDEKRMVYGYASTEALDSQGEIVRKDAIEEALPDYMRFANVREMHQQSAVGVAKEASMDDKGLYLTAHVVDDSAWAKVKAGVYKGFSIGGKALERLDNVVSKLRLSEISLVDRPANPEAVFDVFKADGQGMGEDDGEDDEDEEEGQEVGKRSFTQEERDAAAKKGHAMPDGSYPINTVKDLENAIQSYGRAKDKEAVKKHIIKRAKALGATDKLPEDWSKAEAPDDLQKWLGDEAWTAGRACDCLTTIYTLFDGEQREGDKDQIAALKQVIDGLKSFIASEIKEPMETGKEDSIAYADQSGDIEKAGARNSKKDSERIQAMHDHTIALGASCGAEKSATPDDIQKAHDESMAKIEELQNDIDNMRLEKADMEKRIADLEAMPVPVKGVLTPIAKGEMPAPLEPEIDESAELSEILSQQNLPPFVKAEMYQDLQKRLAQGSNH